MENLKSNSRRQNSSKLINFWVFFLLFFVLLISPETLWAQKTVAVSIGTAAIGGIYYPYGGTIAQVISKYVPGVEATAEVTNGGVDNCKLLGAGKIELALISTNVAYDALMGKGVFKEKIPIRNLASSHCDVTYIVCIEGKGINSVRDLKGKRVSTVLPGSAGEVVALAILEAYGIDPNKDIKRERLSAGDAARALGDGKLDAFFWTAGFPGAAIMDLAATPGIKMKILDHGEVIPKVIEKYGPQYIKTILPANTYRGVDYDVTTLGIMNFLGCHEKMDEKLAYNIVRVLFEHKNELVAGHQVAKNLTLENQEVASAIPYHPGAVKYYKEKRLKVTF